MNVPINTFQDILDALEQNPDLRDQLRRHILSEDILQMPAQLQAVILQIGELQDGQQAIVARIEMLEKRMGGLEGRMDGLEGRMGGLERRMDGLDGRMDGLDGRMGRVEGRLGNIEGGIYERRATQRAIPHVVKMGITRPRVAFAGWSQAPQHFYDVLDDAVNDGRIDEDEYIDLVRTDLIVRGTNNQNALFEISLGPDDYDMTRSLRRAEILQRAAQEIVIPGVIASEADNGFIDRAFAIGVSVLVIPN